MGNPLAVHVLLGFVNHHKPDILFLSKMLSSSERMERLRVQLKYECCFAVSVQGHSGGLALLWNGGLEVEVVGYSNHYIDALVSSRVSSSQ